MWIVPWDPFLIYIFLNKVPVGPMNSAWIVPEQCVNNDICLMNNKFYLLETREKKNLKTQRQETRDPNLRIVINHWVRSTFVLLVSNRYNGRTCNYWNNARDIWQLIIKGNYAKAFVKLWFTTIFYVGFIPWQKKCCNCFNLFPCILWDFIVLGLVSNWWRLKL